MIRATTFSGVQFYLTHDTAHPRLVRLIEWLRSEEARLVARLAEAPQGKPQFDAMNRPVLTPEQKLRAQLENDLANVRADIYGARSWLVECTYPQSWSVSAEISGWLNRPILADSSEG